MDKIILVCMILLFMVCAFIQVVVICALNEAYRQLMEENGYRTKVGVVNGIDTYNYKDGDIIVLSKTNAGCFEVKMKGE